jgi:hypothetical protein
MVKNGLCGEREEVISEWDRMHLRQTRRLNVGLASARLAVTEM